MKRTIYTGEAGNFEKAVVTMPNKYGYGGAHQPNIIGNKETMIGTSSAFANTSKIVDPNQTKNYNYGQQSQSQEQPKLDADMYNPIVPKRTAEQELRMGTRTSKTKN